MTMILWLMVAPGNWQMYVDVYKDEAECRRAEQVLVKAVPKIKLNTRARQVAHIRKLYTEGSDAPGFYWIGCH